MNNFIYPEYSMNDRVKMLKNMSVKTAVKTYNRSLSDSEIDTEKDKFASDCMELERQKSELKAQSDRLKSGIKSIDTLIKERLERIKTGQMETTSTLYGLPDYSKGTMNWYDSYGECINRTPLTPDEKQGTMFIGEDVAAAMNSTAAPYKLTDDSGNEIIGVPTHEAENDSITDVDFEEMQEVDDAELNKAIDQMYEGEGGSVHVEVTEPVEDKPAKRPKKKKGENSDPL